MSAVSGHKCETPDCDQPATLQCPTCLKIGIQGSFFCNQTCFKGFWKQHKIIHELASECKLSIFTYIFMGYVKFGYLLLANYIYPMQRSNDRRNLVFRLLILIFFQ